MCIRDRPITLALTGKAEVFNNKQSFREKLFASCDNYIATTHEIKESFIKDAHINPDKISVIPHGIDIKKYPFVSYEDRCIAKQQAGLDSVIPNLLFCARVAPNKGILIALEVWKQIYEHYPDSKFYIVGGGDNTLLDEARSVSEQCNNSIIVVGEVDDVTPVSYTHLDVYKRQVQDRMSMLNSYESLERDLFGDVLSFDKPMGYGASNQDNLDYAMEQIKLHDVDHALEDIDLAKEYPDVYKRQGNERAR